MAREERRLTEWLVDIVEWGDRIPEYILGMDEGAFLADRKTQDAVVRCLECIGEASRQILSAEEAARQFRGLELVEAYWTRNRLAHGYFTVNMSRVWLTATVSAPKLVAAARELLDDLG